MISAALLSSAAADWTTPQDLFDELDAEFHFELDPCATPENAKCAAYFTAEQDGLVQPWAPAVVFMNPPYGRQIGRWVEKAEAESRAGATVVALVPARTDTRWWHECIADHEVRFLRGRLRFGSASSGAPFPSAVVIFRETDSRNACNACGRRRRRRSDARYCSNACRQRAYRKRVGASPPEAVV